MGKRRHFRFQRESARVDYENPMDIPRPCPMRVRCLPRTDIENVPSFQVVLSNQRGLINHLPTSMEHTRLIASRQTYGLRLRFPSVNYEQTIKHVIKLFA